jgi:hypothetical protein
MVAMANAVPALPATATGRGDFKDFCDSPGEALAAEKPANTKGLTTLTTQNDKDAQCGAGEPDPDGW